MGVPGWPEFAFCTASIDSVRIVLTQSSSSPVCSVTAMRSTSRSIRRARYRAMRGEGVHPQGSWEGGRGGLSLVAMSIIQTTATTSPGARRHPAVTPGRPDLDPWAGMAGTRVEHTWRGSHVVLEVDSYERTDAPLREARRALRR